MGVGGGGWVEGIRFVLSRRAMKVLTPFPSLPGSTQLNYRSLGAAFSWQRRHRDDVFITPS